jgi:hypothetical protein
MTENPKLESDLQVLFQTSMPEMLPFAPRLKVSTGSVRRLAAGLLIGVEGWGLILDVVFRE